MAHINRRQLIGGAAAAAVTLNAPSAHAQKGRQTLRFIAEKLGQRLLGYTIAIAVLTVILCALTAALVFPGLLKWLPCQG